MSFRISTHIDGSVTTIRVEGQFATRAVSDLKREFNLTGRSVRLDLTGLTTADAHGVRELLKLSDKGVELQGLSVYIRQLLHEAIR